ncbi:nitrogenase iron-molybdenum cofactor biosynthesis protein NifN [Vibrio sp. FNV 38]|nr:nitrogenase iron-molybdenum cofactor biosynthesis protein NifN [Vibrio sp. FNV 38]
MKIANVQTDALVTKPLKTSPATGAALATMGFNGSIPLIHGAQGCSAFSKVYLISHFREPFPIQNSAIDQVSAVMGTEENLTEALKNICERQKPKFISVLTSGLVEMQGCDIWLTVKKFRVDFPEYSHVEIVPVSTPDFRGTMETGFAKLVNTVVKQCCDQAPLSVITNQVNVLCSVSVTPADIDLLERYLNAFDLQPIFLPDLSSSMDGHLEKSDHQETSTGGTTQEQLSRVSSSRLTIVIGQSMRQTAVWLNTRFAIPWFEVSMGIAETDKLIYRLSNHTGKQVPFWMTRARSRLQDAMLDTHFVITNAPVAMAVEPDLAIGLNHILCEVGADIQHIVTTYEPLNSSIFDPSKLSTGDMSLLDGDYENIDVLYGNSHIGKLCPSNIGVIKVGFPCNDHYGNTDQCYLGYEGMRSQLFRLANTLHQVSDDEVKPHVSRYAFTQQEVTHDCS